ncbi:hypothetical protein [Marinicauda salina]|uniref:hypothetical protein n=1 Tax=Marinicauda salina TaxID=2135793 RepID=UPI001304D77B|nr:hypothetical protein [Marinicauda salina]
MLIRGPIVLLAFLSLPALLTACVPKRETTVQQIGENDLNHCVINPELIIQGNTSDHTRLEIQYCNIISSNGDEKIIIVERNGRRFFYTMPTQLGARVYAEYQFGDYHDIMLISFGFDSPDERGNFFDYRLYEVGGRGLIRTGKSAGRPRISDLM